MSPTVSLMVPTFNRADLIGPCIDSALAQTATDLEVVVVDGASTDETWEICQRYANLDLRVRAFREGENRGPVLGWWRCLEEARGTFATFLWSDDLLRPTFLERTLPFLADQDVAFAYTAAEIGETPGSGKVRYRLDVTGLIESRVFIDGSLRERGRFPLSPACGLFRTDELRQNFMTELPTDPPFDLTTTGAGTDVLMFLNAAARRPKVAHVAEPLAFFRSHPGSITIDGRAGLVARSYAAARSWFANAHGRADLVPTIVAWQWLADVRTSRTFISPWAASRRYGGLASPWSLIVAATRAFTVLARSRLRIRGRNQHTASPNVRERPKR